MTKNYYAVKSGPNPDGTFTFYTADVDACQIILGWGGTSNQTEADFYGNDAKDAPSELRGNLYPKWKWSFGHDHARKMLGLIEEHEHDDDYYNAAERKRLPDLKKVLRFILEH